VLENNKPDKQQPNRQGEFGGGSVELSFSRARITGARRSCPFRICFPESFAAACQASVIWKDAPDRAFGTGIARDRVGIS